jgi:mitochondrial fission protein ELM1
LSCWVVTDGKAGMESQCVGLAEALGLEPTIKRVALKSPWRQLTPRLRLFQSRAFAAESDPLLPPWPDLLIATGRQSVAASLYVREQSRKQGRGTVTVQLQDPRISPRHFDLVVAPRHDRLAGANVVSTHGALHRITRQLLAEGADKLSRQLGDLPRPYIVFLVGGSNAAYRLGARKAAALGAQIAKLARAKKGSVLVTPSRRTDPEAVEAISMALRGVPHFLWEGSGDNPYFGLLGLADFLVVTEDSVNMVSEACATGKPVYVAHLPGGSPKFRRFHRALRAEGCTRTFSGALEPYYYPPPDDMGMVVQRVRQLFDAPR